MDLTLVYCFTFKLTEPEIFIQYRERILEVLKTSIDYNKRFHPVVLYTDSLTLQYIDPLDIEVKLVDSKDFIFTDDFKLSLHPNLKDEEVLIDFDVFLQSKLNIDTSKDIIIEKYEDPKFFYRYERTLDQLKPYEILGYFNSMNILKNKMPNIGILKVNNKIFWEKYIKEYNQFRSKLLNELQPEDNPIKYSAMLGQYLLNNLLIREEPSIYVCNENNLNSYLHINSYEKYLHPLNQLIGSIKPKLLI